MARGTEAKNSIFSKLMSVYKDAFWEDENKILRIPVEEGGNLVEIKVTLTAAKTNLKGDTLSSAFDNDAPAPAEKAIVPNPETFFIEPSEEEKENVKRMMDALGLI